MFWQWQPVRSAQVVSVPHIVTLSGASTCGSTLSSSLFRGPSAHRHVAEESGYELTSSMAPAEKYPLVDDIDFLVIMGGPMAADDHHVSPWLVAEKRFVAEVIAAGKLVLGVCLGAQIVAEVWVG